MTGYFTFLILLVFTRGLIVFLHEMGHAIPTILLEREKVIVYIGSYGDPNKSISFNIGRLEFWLSYIPFSWKNGLCISHSKTASINQQIVCIIMGPLFSLILSTLFILYAFKFELNDLWIGASIIFLVLSIHDVFLNLIPSSKAIKLNDGSITYNDGYQIRSLVKQKKITKKYIAAIDLYNDREYEKALVYFTDFLQDDLQDDQTYRLAISCQMLLKNHKEAKTLIDKFMQVHPANDTDYGNAGLTYSNLNLHEKALEFYDLSLSKNNWNSYSLNNKGYTLNLLEKYDEAISFFEKAIEIDPYFAYSFNNRGLAKIKSGDIENGLRDIQTSIKLDDKNSYSYRNLGIYHYDIGEPEEALRLFEKAKALDKDTHMIDELISSVKTTYSL